MFALPNLIPYREPDDETLEDVKNRLLSNKLNGKDYDNIRYILSKIEVKRYVKMFGKDEFKKMKELVDRTNVQSDKYVCNVLEMLTSTLDKYKGQNVEVEFRLGLNSQSDFGTTRFISSVSKDFFTKIMKLMEGSSVWKDKKYVKTKNTQDKNGVRCTEYDDGRRVYMKKRKLVCVDMICDNSPFVIRMSISEEKICEEDEFSVVYVGSERKIERVSYNYKDMWSYDLSRVKYVDNTIDRSKYEIEIELLGMKGLLGGKYDSRYVVHSGLLKMKDMINMIWEKDIKLEFHNIQNFI